MRKFTTSGTASLLCAIAIGATHSVLAQTQAATPAPAAAVRQPALNEMDCRALLRLGGDERAYALLYLHGFVSGRLNQLVLPTDELAAATDRVIEHCIDKPNDKLLPVFEQIRKSR